MTEKGKVSPSVQLYVAILWECPNCHIPNEDFFDTTINPMCEGCMYNDVWENLLDQETYDIANRAYAELDGQYENEDAE